MPNTPTTNLQLGRQLPVFDPTCLGNRTVGIIGQGAVGGKIAMACAKHGVKRLRLYDFDVVEAHNICNQLFGVSDVGKRKVDAVRAAIKRDTGIEAVALHGEVKGPEIEDDIVFMAVDKMSVRRAIWDGGLKMKIKGNGPRTQLMIETRMGADCGYVYSVNPCDMTHIENWEKTLYSDEKAQFGVCGLPISVGATADMTASWAVWQFMNWCNVSLAKKAGRLFNELFFSTGEPVLLRREFK